MRRQAASVLVLADGRVLGITRGIDLGNITLPGGRAEPTDLSLAHTAARELWEETGVVVPPDTLLPLIQHGVHTTFYATQIDFWPSALSSRPFEGFVALWPPQAFLGPRCTYAEQYAQVFDLAGV